MVVPRLKARSMTMSSVGSKRSGKHRQGDEEESARKCIARGAEILSTSSTSSTSCHLRFKSVRADQHGRGERSQHDVFVMQPIFGALLRAPLAHADAVPPAVAFHEA